MKITLRHFEIVDAIAQCKGITRAASMLDITQPALTRALKVLEDQIGKELFTRSPQGLEPTEAARVILKRKKTISTALETMLHDLERLRRQETGKILIGTGYWASAVSVELAVARLTTLYPRLAIEIVSGMMADIEARIRSGQIELGVLDISTFEEDPLFATEVLNTAPSYFFVRRDHPVLKLDRPTLRDLAAYPHVGSEWVDDEKQIVSQYGAGFGYFDPSTGVMLPLINARAFGSMRNIVLHSDAIGMGLLSMIEEEVADGRLVLLDDPDLVISYAYYGFVYRKDRPPSPLLIAFMDMVRSVEAERKGLTPPPPHIPWGGNAHKTPPR